MLNGIEFWMGDSVNNKQKLIKTMSLLELLAINDNMRKNMILTLFKNYPSFTVLYGEGYGKKGIIAEKKNEQIYLNKF
jgi:hypothetical protein